MPDQPKPTKNGEEGESASKVERVGTIKIYLYITGINAYERQHHLQKEDGAAEDGAGPINLLHWT